MNREGVSAKTARWVALASAAYVLLAGAVLQGWIIPATPWHGGHGLLAGGDWLYFHDLALGLAQQIDQQGWSAWILRPEDQAPAGVAAALYALTGVHRPWVLLPLHAMLYALIALCLWRMVADVSGNNRVGLWALVPLFVFPSLAMVYGHIHKDIYALPVVLTLLLAWVWMLLRGRSHLWWIVLLLLLGNALVWLVRPYGLKLLLLGQAGMWLVFLLGWYWHRKTAALLLGGVAVVIGAIFLDLSRPEAAPTADTAAVIPAPAAVIPAPAAVIPAQAAAIPAPPTCPGWVYILPSLLQTVDGWKANVACVRQGFAGGYMQAGSNIDIHVRFTQASDVVLYLPRALQIGWLAPFPSMWLGDAASPGGQVFRAVAALEMLVLYAALAGLLVFAMLAGFRATGFAPAQVWAACAVLGFALLWVLAYTLVVTNVGTLYRMRLPAVLVVMGLGWVAWHAVWRQWHPGRVKPRP